ncbi:MAG TPA: hypothetical protein VIN08_11840 [Ohtaekwangia sp.]|uniref:hypothetical protein n=1 Tax=Ohtaekwangia sp. TaxID=2066019 RepID=UPI002F9261D3
MSSIRTYKELLEEKERLRATLELQKLQLKTDVKELKEELRPLMVFLSVLGKITSRETRNDAIVSTGSALAIDLLSRKVLPKNNLVRMFVPGILKNVASHLLYSAKPLLQKLMSSRKKDTALGKQ